MNSTRIEELTHELLREIGEDPEREGLQKTPARVASALEFLTAGYREDVAEIVNGAVFTAESRDMVICRNIEIYSLCEHHLLPFYGQCHIGYIPRGKLLGISKLARVANCFARRLQIQERLTAQIAQAIMDAVGAEGVGVVLECRHMCMMMRGVEKQNSSLTTSSVLGSFRSELSTRTEFLDLITR
jgi:GTP cyclohydrolase I